MASEKGPDQRFQDLLDGRSAPASPDAERLAALASALRPASLATPDATFRRRLRSELLARAAMTEEDLFAAALDGSVIEAPRAMRPLLAVASSLRGSSLSPAAAPAPSFRFQLRNSLVAQASRTGGSIGQRISGWLGATNTRLQRRTRFVAAMSMAVMAMLGTSAVFAAASSAIPGDALYGIKRAHENVRMTVLAGEPEGRLRLELARERLSEVAALKDRAVVDDALYIGTLDLMDRLTTTGAVILLDVYQRTGDRAAVDFVGAFAAEQIEELSALVSQLPPGVRPAARDSLGLIEATAREVEITLTGCGGCPVDNLLSTPTAEAEGRALRSPGCECPQPTPTDSSGHDDGSSQEPDGSDDPGEEPTRPEPPKERPAVDLPDELPDEVEEPGESIIDQIVDTIQDTLPPPVSDLVPTPPTSDDLGL